MHNIESEVDDTLSEVNVNNNEIACPIKRKCKKSLLKEEFVTFCIQEYQEQINCLAKANRLH